MKKFVVYLDGSFQFSKEGHKVGSGIYIVGEDLNDIKIAIGQKTTKIENSLAAEIETLKQFVKYVKNNSGFKDAEFTFYCDCELLVNMLNSCSRSNPTHRQTGRQVKGLATINIRNAYWVKSHKEELGNLVVDTLAYNAMRNVDNSDGFLLIQKNADLVGVFEALHRFPKILQETAGDNKQLNELCFNRMMDVENNFLKKSESNHNLNKIRIKDQDGIISAIITGNDKKGFCLNGSRIDSIIFEEVLREIFHDVGILKEMNRYANKKLSIQIEDKTLYLDFEQRMGLASKLIERRLDETLDKDLVREETIQFMRDRLNKYAFIIQGIDGASVTRKLPLKRRLSVSM